MIPVSVLVGAVWLRCGIISGAPDRAPGETTARSNRMSSLVGDAVHVRIHTDAGHNIPGAAHAKMGHFCTHTRQLEQTFDAVGNVSSVLVD